jgi:hypothetical protein
MALLQQERLARCSGRKTNYQRCPHWYFKHTYMPCFQRAGVADGGGFYIRPPGTAAWLFDKVKY